MRNEICIQSSLKIKLVHIVVDSDSWVCGIDSRRSIWHYLGKPEKEQMM